MAKSDRSVTKEFGWNLMEGFHCYRAASCNQEGLTPPVVEYGHDAGCSIIGGLVYRGAAPPRLAGAYVATVWDTVAQEVRDVPGLPGPSELDLSTDGRTLILNRRVSKADIWMLTLE